VDAKGGDHEDSHVRKPSNFEPASFCRPVFIAGPRRTRFVGIGQECISRYTIKFTAGQLASIGAMNFDVTKFVRSGQLIVA
jgi:hypothetical protein